MARHELAAALSEAFKPLPLNEFTLPLALELPEFDERPELVEALLN